METLGDLVARERRTRSQALRAVGEPDRRYDYYQLCTTAQKAGNFFRHHAVRPGTTVAITDDPEPTSILACFGAALLGATARFGIPESFDDVSLLVSPARSATRYDLPPGTNHVVYGGTPRRPSQGHFESGVWSENPSVPDADALTADSEALSTDDATYTHAALLDAGRTVVDDVGITAADRVAVRAPLSRPWTVVAGVVVPLLAGAELVFPDDRPVDDAYAVTDGAAPERVTIGSDDVPI